MLEARRQVCVRQAGVPYCGGCSTLPPADVRRQMGCGLRHVGRLPAAPPSTPPCAPSIDGGALQRQLAALWNRPPPDAGKHDLPFGANVLPERASDG